MNTSSQVPADNIYQVHPDFPMQLIFQQQSVILMRCGPRKGLLLNWIRRRCSNIEANRRRRLVVTGRWTWMGSVHGDRGSINPTATAMPADAFPGPFLVPLTHASKNDRLVQRSLHGATHGHVACRRKLDSSYRDARRLRREIGRWCLSAGINEPKHVRWTRAPGFSPGSSHGATKLRLEIGRGRKTHG